MATATMTPTPTKAARPTGGTCGLTLRINGTAYVVRPLDVRGFGAVKAFRLSKQAGKGEVYDVATYPDGHATSDCGDWTFRRAGAAAPCKHLAACAACGLIG